MRSACATDGPQRLDKTQRPCPDKAGSGTGGERHGLRQSRPCPARLAGQGALPAIVPVRPGGVLDWAFVQHHHAERLAVLRVKDAILRDDPLVCLLVLDPAHGLPPEWGTRFRGAGVAREQRREKGEVRG